MDPKEEIKQKTDIAELIGGYLTLKPSGMASFKGLCPFHAEKSPSFHVSTDKQIFHCFGCSEGGDCFSFVMKMEGMEFPEALKFLGDKVGVEVKRYDSTEGNERARLVAVNELAAKFYRKVLMDSPAAEQARAYVAGRGIGAELAEKFGLGYAPDAWDTLSSFLQKKGYRDGDGEKAGLTQRRKSGVGHIDRFRHRLMIPLCDQHGAVVGFTGRIIPTPYLPTEASAKVGPLPPPPSDGPKYMNSPETAVYHKGSLLYGLHLAKQAIKRAGSVVIVEGNLDVIASHKAGVENVVGSSGTALTEEQLALLKRFTGTIAFSFDRDAAGFKAAQKGIALARAMGFDVRATVLPQEAGKDPDEAVQKDPALWREAAGRSVPIMQFMIERAVLGRDLSDVDDKRAVSALILPELRLVTDVVEREHWLQTVADLLRTDIGALRSAIGPATRTAPAPARDLPPTSSRSSKQDASARALVGLAIQSPSWFDRVAKTLGSLPLPEPWATLYSLVKDQYHLPQTDLPGQTGPYGRLRSAIEAHASQADLVPLLDTAALDAERLLAGVAEKDLPGQVTELVHILVAADAKRRREAIEADIRRAERDGDREAVERLIKELTSLR
ncbi:DNA primase [Patescibacteria group bacterium]|nr:MAG: DNA primase [Patescibacteria group bacterium]